MLNDHFRNVLLILSGEMFFKFLFLVENLVLCQRFIQDAKAENNKDLDAFYRFFYEGVYSTHQKHLKQ